MITILSIVISCFWRRSASCSARGTKFIQTLTTVDVATGWIVRLRW
jgi:hypothetical protein